MFRRKTESVLHDANSVLHDGLIEVEDRTGHQREGGQLVGGQTGVVRLFAHGQKFHCCFRVFPKVFLVSLKILHQQIEFRRAWLAAGHASERLRQALARWLAFWFHHPLAVEARCLHEGLVVHHRERLQRRGGEVVSHDADFPCGGIESCHRGRRQCPAPVGVQASPVKFSVFILLVFRVGDAPPNTRRHVRLHRWASKFIVQQITAEQRRVANGKRREALARAAGEQPVFRIAGMCDPARLPVRGAGDDKTVHRLQVPVVPHNSVASQSSSFG